MERGGGRLLVRSPGFLCAPHVVSSGPNRGGDIPGSAERCFRPKRQPVGSVQLGDGRVHRGLGCAQALPSRFRAGDRRRLGGAGVVGADRRLLFPGHQPHCI